MIVGVFVKGSLEGIEFDFWNAVQLHGYDRETELPSSSTQIYAAVSAKTANAFPSTHLIIDESWGRGRKADWSKLAGIQRSFVLSGGLDAENVFEAVTACSPSGVDVCSGVEKGPGVKDYEKMRLFIERADAALKQHAKTKAQQ